MKNKIFFSILFVGLLASGVGCKSNGGGMSAYVQPRIEGRVIDSDTKMPIERVVILRNPQSTSRNDHLHAGQIMEEQHSIYSDEDGVFKVPSKKVLEMGGDRTWTSVTLKFLHEDYQMYSTNFLHHPGGDEEGEPLLETGDILLHRLP